MTLCTLESDSLSRRRLLLASLLLSALGEESLKLSSSGGGRCSGSSLPSLSSDAELSACL
jgi:hypothetical protein